METFPPRISKSSPRRSSARSAAPLGDSFPGNGLVQKRTKISTLASVSTSQGSDSTSRDTFSCELGQGSSGQAIVKPIKKLLAEEMLRETESKRRSPSVIARLMGLDGMPSQPPAHKQQKRSSDSYQQQRTILTEKAHRNGVSSSRRSSRKSSKEEQEFKDVFEVLDGSRMESSSHSSQGIANSTLTEADLAFVQQRFMDAKRLSTDEKLQNSEEFQNAIEDLDSNKDLLLKFLEQPDSLFTKHLHDLQRAPSHTHCGHMSAMKTMHNWEYGGGVPGSRRDRKTPCRDRRKPHNDLLCHSSSKHLAHYPHKSSEVELEGKDESSIAPTRIVVLKPNLARMQTAVETVSSPCSSYDFLSDCRKHTELPSVKNREPELQGKQKFSDYGRPLRHKSRESREIAKEITRQMRSSFNNGSGNFPTAGFKGYAGDESSSNRSETESANESEFTTVTSKSYIDCGRHNRHSSSHSNESSVGREARKRLSARWKLTHKSVDMGVVSRGSTLGEMLAIPDGEVKPVKPAKSGSLVGGKVTNGELAGNGGMAERTEPLGISSRDGWKDGCIGTLSRSRSVPALSTASAGSPKMGMRHEILFNNKYVMPREVMPRERHKALRGNLSQREGSSSRNLRSYGKKSYIFECTSSDRGDTSPEINCGHIQVQCNIKEGDPFTENHGGLDASAKIGPGTCLIPENSLNVVIDGTAMTCQPTDAQSSPHTLTNENCSSSLPDTFQEPLNGPMEKDTISMQCPATEVESPESTKEADQPSPISILETPFPDDLSSSSECFESLSADLHGLRMQLQLLKLESEAYVEGPMAISSDEDVEELSGGLSEEKEIAGESREFSYVVDVLADSGINKVDPDSFLATWHSAECPVNPLVFEELEKKYYSHASWQRCERRLLFDRVNSALIFIYRQFADPRLWVRSAPRIGRKWMKDGLEHSLLKLLTSQDEKASKDASDEVLAGESQWLDLGDDIDVIAREMERLLLEELVKELVTM